MSESKKPPGTPDGFYCGERGIRTPGTSRYNGFQDRRIRPLCHLSEGVKSRTIFLTAKTFLRKKLKIDKKKNNDSLFFQKLFQNLVCLLRKTLKLLILLAF